MRAPSALLRTHILYTAYQPVRLYSFTAKPTGKTNDPLREINTMKKAGDAKIDLLGRITMEKSEKLKKGSKVNEEKNEEKKYEDKKDKNTNSVQNKEEEEKAAQKKNEPKKEKKVKKKRKLFKLKLSDFKLKEQPVGNIVGTVNDAVKIPPMDFYKGSYHWDYERIVTVSMVPLALAPFVIGIEHPYIDAIFSILLLIHCRYGFQSCIIDYIPERRFGIWHKVAMWALDLGSWLALYGVYVIETEANGLFALVCHIWGA